MHNSKEYFEKWIKYLKIKKSMVEIQDGGYSSGQYKSKWYVSHMFGCPKACFVRLRGGHMPPYIWMPHLFGCTPVCFNAPICLDGPVFVWIPLGTPLYFGCPICLDTPICLDASCMFRCCLCLDNPLYGGCPHMFGCPLYVWIPPKCMGASKGMRTSKYIGSV